MNDIFVKIQNKSYNNKKLFLNFKIIQKLNNNENQKINFIINSNI